MGSYAEWLEFLYGQKKIEEEKSLVEQFLAYSEFYSNILDSLTPQTNFNGEIIALGGLLTAVFKLLSKHPRIASHTTIVNLLTQSFSYLAGLGLAGPLFFYFILIRSALSSQSLSLGVILPSILSFGTSLVYPTLVYPAEAQGIWNHLNLKNLAIGLASFSVLSGLSIW